MTGNGCRGRLGDRRSGGQDPQADRNGEVTARSPFLTSVRIAIGQFSATIGHRPEVGTNPRSTHDGGLIRQPAGTKHVRRARKIPKSPGMGEKPRGTKIRMPDEKVRSLGLGFGEALHFRQGQNLLKAEAKDIGIVFQPFARTVVGTLEITENDMSDGQCVIGAEDQRVSGVEAQRGLAELEAKLRVTEKRLEEAA
jgi:hypothetical protein